jgi:hypothetical protein
MQRPPRNFDEKGRAVRRSPCHSRSNVIKDSILYLRCRTQRSTCQSFAHPFRIYEMGWVLSFPNLSGRNVQSRHGVAGIDDEGRPNAQFLVVDTGMIGRD